MFETVEVAASVDKTEYKTRIETLRPRLLEAQVKLREAGVPVVVVFSGVDGAGKGQTTDLLNQWMDPRWINTHAYVDPTDEERERPAFWRYWRDLPGKGEMGIFLSAWYSAPLLAQVHGGEQAELDARLDEISAFEDMLAADGTLVIKFWMHLSAEAQRRRLEELQADEEQSWRVRERDWRHLELYDRFILSAERMIMRTSTGKAQWHLVDGSDEYHRSLAVGEILASAIEGQLGHAERAHQAAQALRLERESSERKAAKLAKKKSIKASVEVKVLPGTVLSGLDLSQRLKREEYQDRLAAAQNRLGAFQREAFERGISTLAVFEGPDAAGKGGAIRRITHALDAKSYRVIPIAKPTDEEISHHYLWRFWRHLPRAGRVTIFDRSWYGRVMVERVEGFASQEEWQRAYGEINHFEGQLIDDGMVLAKFYVQISPEEQLARFKDRARVPYKRWKLTDEDWRNRGKWNLYEAAVHDLIQRTSSHSSPWTLVEGDDKRFSRVKVVETLADRLGAAIQSHDASPHPERKDRRRILRD